MPPSFYGYLADVVVIGYAAYVSYVSCPHKISSFSRHL
jgi:hypothetical protein